jgi:hypothetical protein
MEERRLTLSPDELATLATIVVRYPGLASTARRKFKASPLSDATGSAWPRGNPAARAAPEPKGRAARATRRGRASCDARSRSMCWRVPAVAGG